MEKPNKQSVLFNGQYINLSEISRKTDIHISCISRIFSHDRQPTVEHLRKISKTLGVSVQALLDSLDRAKRPLKLAS